MDRKSINSFRKPFPFYGKPYLLHDHLPPYTMYEQHGYSFNFYSNTGKTGKVLLLFCRILQISYSKGML